MLRFITSIFVLDLKPIKWEAVAPAEEAEA
jgi:hypothetical protein